MISAKVIIIPRFRWDEVMIVLHFSVYKEKKYISANHIYQENRVMLKF